MKNIEKYKDEILKYAGYQHSLMCLIYENIMKKNDCTGCCSKCKRETIKWLTSEYKEPILTDKAKSYLKLILEPSKCTIIQKLVEDEEIPRKYKLLCSTDSGYIAILYKPGTKYYEYFKNMENDKTYTPEELDL